MHASPLCAVALFAVLFSALHGAQCVPPAQFSKSVDFAPGGDLDASGTFSPGDILRYTLDIELTGGSLTTVAITDTLPLEVSLIGGTLTAVPAFDSVVSGDLNGDLLVSAGWGSLDVNAVVTFDVSIPSLSLDLSASNQAALSCFGFITPLLSDDPSTIIPIDATSITIVRPPIVDLNGVFAGINTTAIYVEGAVAVPICPLAAVIDTDSIALAQCTAELTPNGPLLDPSFEQLSAIGSLAVSVMWSGDTLVMAGSATPLDYQLVLQTLSYINTDHDPNPADRIVRIVCTDDEGSLSVAAEVTVTVVPVNDPPVVDLNGVLPLTDISVTFVEDGGSILAVSPLLTITDVDSTMISGCTVIGVPFPDAPFEILSVDDSTSISITATYATPTLTISGTATLAEYETVLRSLEYYNLGLGGILDNPTDWPDRILTIQCIDDSGEIATQASLPVISTLTVVAIDDPPVVDLNGPIISGVNISTVYLEGSPPLPLCPLNLVSDPDSLNLLECSLQITNTPIPDGADELLSAVAPIGISATYSNGVLLLSGTAPVVVYETVMRTVTYENTNANPTTGVRTVVVECIDESGLPSAMASVRVDVQIINDSPIVDLNGLLVPGVQFSATALENTPTSVVSADVAVTDSDSTMISGCTISIVLAPDALDESLSAVDQGSVTSSFLGNTLTLSGTDTLEVYEDVLRSVTYLNDNENPTVSIDRQVSFVCRDDSSDLLTESSLPALCTVTVVPVSDPPVLDLDGLDALAVDVSLTYNEGSGSLILPTVPLIVDVDSLQLSQCTATLHPAPALDGLSEFLSVETVLFPTIFAQYDPSTGVLLMQGIENIAVYEGLLALVSYTNNDANPTAQPNRRVEFVCTDTDGASSTPVSAYLAVVPNDNAPLLDANGMLAGENTAVVYVEGAAAVRVMPTATIVDVDSASLLSCTAILTPFPPPDGIGIELLDLDESGLPLLATAFTSATGILSFSGILPVEDYQQVIQSITYINTADDPSATPDRVVTVRCLDDSGLLGNNVTSTITCQPVNNPPVVDLNGPLIPGVDVTTTFLEGTGPTLIVDPLGLSVYDVDSMISGCTIVLEPLLDGANELLSVLDAGLVSSSLLSLGGSLQLELLGTDTALQYALVLRTLAYDNTDLDPDTSVDRVVTVVCRDDSGEDNAECVPATSTITVIAVDDAPVVDLNGPLVAGLDFNAGVYEEGGSPLALVDVDLALITDPDSLLLAECSATFTVPPPDGSDERLLFEPSQLTVDLTAAYHADVELLEIAGEASVGVYIDLLRSLKYENVNGNPTAGTRSIEVSCVDLSGLRSLIPAICNVTVLPINTPPVLDICGNDPLTTFVEDSGAVSIFPDGVHILDVDSISLSACLVVVATEDGVDESLTLSGSIGSLAEVTTSLVSSIEIDISGVASLVDYENALNLLVYNNTNEDPSSLVRVVIVTCIDVEGAISLPSTCIFNVVPTNDAPIVDLSGPGSPGVDHTAVFVEDAGAVPIAAADALLSDVDSIEISVCAAVLVQAWDLSFEFLELDPAFSTPISSFYDAVSHTLTLQGVETLAEYTEAIRHIRYNNLAEIPDTRDRIIEVSCTDVNVASPEVSLPGLCTLTILPSIDIPVVDLNGPDEAGTGFSATFVEGDGPVSVVDSDCSIVDVDSVDLASCVAQLSPLPDLNNETLSADISLFASISASYDINTGILLLSAAVGGAAPVEDFEGVLRTLVYENLKGNPTTSPARLVTIVCNDTDGGASVPSLSLISMVAANDPVLVDLNGPGIGLSATATFTEDGPAVSIAPDVSLVDVDGHDIERCDIKILNALDGGLELIVATTPAGIVATWDEGTLNVVNTGTTTEYASILASLTYENLSEDPDSTDRIIEVVCVDTLGIVSNAAVCVMSVVPVNDLPILDLSGPLLNVNATVTFIEDEGPVLLANAGASITDVDDVNLQSCSATLQSKPDGALEVLSASSVPGISASFSGTVLRFTGIASVLDYQEALLSLAYDNTAQDPDVSDREVRVVCVDESGDPSISVHVTIEINAVNDAPLISLNDADAIVFTEDGGGVACAPLLTIVDVDSLQLQRCELRITPRPDGADEVLTVSHGTPIVDAFDVNLGELELEGPALVAEFETVLNNVLYENVADDPSDSLRAISISCEDLEGEESVAVDINLLVIPVNDAPIVDLSGVNEIGLGNSIVYTEHDDPIPCVESDNVITDFDSTLLAECTATLVTVAAGEDEGLLAAGFGSISVSANPNDRSVTLEGVATIAEYEMALARILYYNNEDAPDDLTIRAVEITCTDNEGAESLASTVMITIVPINDPPVITPTLPLDGNPLQVTCVEDEGPVVVPELGITLTDVDSSMLQQCLVQLHPTPDGVDEMLLVGGGAIGGVTTNGYFVVNSTLVLAGPASVADFEANLARIEYNNVNQDPDTSSRTVTFLCIDDIGDLSAAVNIIVDVVATPDAPIVDLNGVVSAGIDFTDPIGWLEGQGPETIVNATAAVVIDVDSLLLDFCVASLLTNPDGDSEFLAVNANIAAAAGIDWSYNPADQELTLTGAADISLYSLLIQSLVYDNILVNPTAGLRTVRIECVDDTALPSAPSLCHFDVVPEDDAPVIDFDSRTPAIDDVLDVEFVEDGPSVAITIPSTTVSDVDSSGLQSCTATLSATPDGVQEGLVIATLPGTVMASYAAGVLTILPSSGMVAPIEDFETALLNSAYFNIAPQPNATVRVITIVCEDDAAVSSSPVNVFVSITEVPDAAVLANGGAPTTAFLEGTPTTVFGSTTVSDVDSTELVSCTAVLRPLPAVPDGPLESLLVNDAGTNIDSSYDSGTQRLRLYGSESLAVYEAVIQTIEYDNASPNPDQQDRVVELQCVDPDGLPSNVISVTVSVTNVPNSPIVDANGPLPGVDHTTTFVEDGGAVELVSGSASVVDLDSDQLERCTIVAVALPDAPFEFLSADTTGTGIEATFAAGTMTLRGPDATGSFEAVMRSVTFENTLQAPTSGVRNFTITCTDTDGETSSAAIAYVIVEGSNNSPVVDLNGPLFGTSFASTFTENGSGASVASAAVSIQDADSSNMEACYITMDPPLADGAHEMIVSTVTVVGITTSASTGSLVLSGPATISDFETALAGVEYINGNALNPTPGDRVLNVFCADDSNDELSKFSEIATSIITVEAINDSPQLDLGGAMGGFSATYVEDADPVRIVSSSLSLQDVDSNNLVGCTLSMSPVFDEEELLSAAASPEISVSYDGGVLTFSGTASVAAYQSVLRTVSYENTNQAPTGGTSRTVTFICTDDSLDSTSQDSAPVTSQIDVIPVNDRPVVDLNGDASSDGFSATFTEGDAPVNVVDPLATIFDADSANLQQCTVTMDVAPDGSDELLSATPVMPIAASYDNMTRTLTLSGSSAIADHEATLRSVRYANNAPAPTSGTRQLTIVCTDGSASSTPSVSTVEVIAENSSPTLLLDDPNEGFSTTFTEGDPAQSMVGSTLVSDVDSAELSSCTVSMISPLPVPDAPHEVITVDAASSSFLTAAYDNANAVLVISGPDTLAAYQTVLDTMSYINRDDDPTTGSRVFEVTCTDNGGAVSDGVRSVIAIGAVNNAPIVDLNGATIPGDSTSVEYTEGDGVVLLVSEDAFVSDVDSATLEQCNATLTGATIDTADEELFVLNSTPASSVASYNSMTGVLLISGTGSVEDYTTLLQSLSYEHRGEDPTAGTRLVTVVCTDSSGDVATQESSPVTVSLDVIAVNNAPDLSLAGEVGSEFETTFEEDGGAVIIVDEMLLTLEDPDSDIIECEVSMSTLDGADEVLSATAGSGVAVSFQSTPGSAVLTLSGTATPAAYESVLRTVSYENNDQDPNDADRIVSFQCRDDSGSATALSPRVHTVLHLESVNNDPVLDLNGPAAPTLNFTTSFVEGGPAVSVTSSAMELSDVDNTEIAQCVVVLENAPDGADERLTFNPSRLAPGVSGDYDSPSQELAFVGLASIESYERLLRTVAYVNTNDEGIDATTRVIRFECHDPDGGASPVVTTAVTISTINHAAVVDLNGSGQPGFDGSLVQFSEGDAPVEVIPDAQLSDADSALFDSCVVVITVEDVGDETLTFSAGSLIGTTTTPTANTIRVEFNDAMGAPQPVAAFESALRSIEYENTNANPTEDPDREMSVECFDDALLGSNVASVFVSVRNVNDAPVIDANGAAAGNDQLTPVVFVEDGAPIAIFNSADMTLSDVDSTSIAECTLTLVASPDGDAESLGLAESFGTPVVVGSYDPVSQSIRLSGVEDVAVYEETLEAIVYENVDDTPTTTARDISVTCTDVEGAEGNATIVTVSVQATDDAPAVDLNGSGAAGTATMPLFIEDEGAVELFPDTEVTDVDSANFLSCNVTIENQPDGAAEVLATSATSPLFPDVGASYDAMSGVLELSGPAAVEQFQEALRTVTYENTLQDPTTDARFISVVCVDNSGVPSDTVYSVVSVQPANDLLSIDLNGGGAGTGISATFTEDGGAVTIAPSATLTDAEADDLVSCSVEIRNVQDVGLELLGTLPPVAISSGVVESYDSDSGILTFSGTASLATYESILQNVTFEVQGDDPTESPARLVAISCTDTADLTSTAFALVSVVPQNDVPTLDLNGGAVGVNATAAYVEGSGASSILSNVEIADVDDTEMQLCTVTLQAPIATGARLSGTSSPSIAASRIGSVLSFSGVASIDEYEAALSSLQYEESDPNPIVPRRVAVECTDASGGVSNEANILIDVTPVNDAPEVDNNGNSDVVSFTENGGGVVIVDPALSISDPDDTTLEECTLTLSGVRDGDDESLSAPVLAGGITAQYNEFDLTLTLSGPAATGDFETVLRSVEYDNVDEDPSESPLREVSIVCTDAGGATGTEPLVVEIEVTGVNNDPVVDLSGLNEAGIDFNTTFTEDQGPISIGEMDLTVSDVDDTELSRCVAAVVATVAGEDDGLAVSQALLPSSITAEYTSSDLELVLYGTPTASVEDFARALALVDYFNNDQDPDDSTERVVEVVCFDPAGGSSAAAFTTISVVAANDAPVVDLNGANDPASSNSAVFVEGSGGVGVTDVDASITDIDSTDIASCELKLSPRPDGTDESLEMTPGVGGIVPSFDDASSILLLTAAGGSEPLSVFEQALRNTVYDNVSEDPDDEVTRTVRVTCTDAEGGVSEAVYSTIEVESVEDAPIVDLNGGAAGTNYVVPTDFIEGDKDYVVVDPDAFVRDVDSTELSTCSVRLTTNLDESDERVIVDSALAALYGITVQALPLSDEVLLIGDAELAEYGQVLQTIVYENDLDDPTPGARVIAVTCTDIGGVTSGVSTSSFTVVAVDDAAVVDLNGPADGRDNEATFLEGEGSTSITSPLSTITDVDSAELASCVATLTNPMDGASELLRARVLGTSLADSYAANALTITPSVGASAPLSEFQTVLRTLEYVNTAADPTATEAVVSVVCTDESGQDSEVALIVITVEGVNDPPVLDLNGVAAGVDYTSMPFTEDGGPVVVVDAAMTLTDVDSANIQSCLAILSPTPDGDRESLSVDDAGSNAESSYNSASGELRISGVDSISEYETVLRTLSYNNVDQDPSTMETRVIELTCIDEEGDVSDEVVSRVTVNAVNNLPTLDLNGPLPGDGFATTLVEGAGPVAVTSSQMTVSDVDDTELQQCTATISGGAPDGSLEWLTADASGFGISVSYVEPTLSLSGLEEVGAYETVLRTLEYDNLSDNPDATPRDIEIVCTDATGDPSTVFTSVITVEGVNDMPVVDLNGPLPGTGFSTVFTENNSSVPIVSSLATVVDPDSLKLHQCLVKMTTVPDGADEGLVAMILPSLNVSFTYDSATGEGILFGDASIASYETALRGIEYFDSTPDPTGSERKFEIVCEDADGDFSDLAIATVEIRAINDPPVLITGIGAGGTFLEGETNLHVFPNGDVTDPDSANLQSLTVKIIGSGDGAFEQLRTDFIHPSVTSSYDTALDTLFLAGIAPIDSYAQILRSISYGNSDQDPTAGRRTIVVTAVDDGGVSSSVSVNITVVAIADPPQLDLNGMQGGHDIEVEFDEQMGPIAIAAHADLTDPDSSVLSSCNVTLSPAPDTPNEYVTTDAAGTSVSLLNGGSFVKLLGPAPIGEFETVLGRLMYDNTLANPTSVNREVSIVCVDDSGVESEEAKVFIEYELINDPPMLDLNGVSAAGLDATAAFLEEGGAVLISPMVTIGDIDSTLLSSCTISVNNLLDPGFEVLAVDIGGVGVAGVTAVYDESTATLTLSGNAALSGYEALLATATYDNLDSDPDTTPRLINFVCADSDGAQSNTPMTTVSITAVNNAPVVDLNGDDPGTEFSTVFVENDAPLGLVSASATVVDLDSAELQFCSIVPTIPLPDGALERLAASSSGFAITITENMGALNLTGPEDVAGFEAALRTVTYEHLGDMPTGSVRGFEITCEDTEGDSSSSVMTSVEVQGVDDPPVVDLNGPLPGEELVLVFTEGDAPLGVTTGDAIVTDVDSTQMSECVAILHGTNVDYSHERLFVTFSPANIAVSYLSGSGRLRMFELANLTSYSTVLNNIMYENDSPSPIDGTRHVSVSCTDDAGVQSAESIVEISVFSTNDPPVVDLSGLNHPSTNYSTFFVKGGNPIPIADLDASIVDEDSAALLSCEVKIMNPFDGSAEFLVHDENVAHGVSLLTRYDEFTHTLAMSGSAPGSSFADVIRTVKYSNVAANPTPDDRDIVAQCSDDTGLMSAPAHSRMVMVLTNEAPDLDLNGPHVGGLDREIDFVEGAGAMLIVPSEAVILANDDFVLGGAGVHLENARDGSNEIIDVDEVTAMTRVIDFQYDSPAHTLVLNGSATAADYLDVLRTVTYSNLDSNPTVSPIRRIAIFLIDADGGVSSESIVSISLTSVPDGPEVQIGGNPRRTTFVEGSSAIPLTASAVNIADPDSTELNMCQAFITPDVDGTEIEGEALSAVQILGSGIDVSYDEASQVLSMIGRAPISTFETVLGTLSYRNTDRNPPRVRRVIQIVCFDESDAAGTPVLAEVDIIGVDDAPVIDLNGDNVPGDVISVDFTEGDGPVLVAPEMRITDVDSTTLSQCTATLTPARDNGFEVLKVEAEAGAVVDYSVRREIAVLGLSGSLPIASYEKMLRSMTYENLFPDPSSEPRIVSIACTDAEGEQSVSVDGVINVIPVDDAPVVDPNPSDPFNSEFSTVFRPGGPPVHVVAPDAVISDVDSGSLSSCYAQLNPIPDGLAEMLAAETRVFGVQQFYNEFTGELALIGPATAEEFTSGLRSITYDNKRYDPDSTPRTVSISCTDVEGNQGEPIRSVVYIAPPVSSSSLLFTYGPSAPSRNTESAEDTSATSAFDSGNTIPEADTLIDDDDGVSVSELKHILEAIPSSELKSLLAGIPSSILELGPGSSPDSDISSELRSLIGTPQTPSFDTSDLNTALASESFDASDVRSNLLSLEGTPESPSIDTSDIVSALESEGIDVSDVSSGDLRSLLVPQSPSIDTSEVISALESEGIDASDVSSSDLLSLEGSGTPQSPSIDTSDLSNESAPSAPAPPSLPSMPSTPTQPSLPSLPSLPSVRCIPAASVTPEMLMMGAALASESSLYSSSSMLLPVDPDTSEPLTETNTDETVMMLPICSSPTSPLNPSDRPTHAAVPPSFGGFVAYRSGNSGDSNNHMNAPAIGFDSPTTKVYPIVWSASPASTLLPSLLAIFITVVSVLVM